MGSAEASCGVVRRGMGAARDVARDAVAADQGAPIGKVGRNDARRNAAEPSAGIQDGVSERDSTLRWSSPRFGNVPRGGALRVEDTRPTLTLDHPLGVGRDGDLPRRTALAGASVDERRGRERGHRATAEQHGRCAAQEREDEQEGEPGAHAQLVATPRSGRQVPCARSSVAVWPTDGANAHIWGRSRRAEQASKPAP
jgi:hypothetical protein